MRKELQKAMRQVGRARRLLVEAGAETAVQCVDDALDALEEANVAYIGSVPEKVSLALRRAVDLVRGRRSREDVG